MAYREKVLSVGSVIHHSQSVTQWWKPRMITIPYWPYVEVQKKTCSYKFVACKKTCSFKFEKLQLWPTYLLCSPSVERRVFGFRRVRRGAPANQLVLQPTTSLERLMQDDEEMGQG